MRHLDFYMLKSHLDYKYLLEDVLTLFDETKEGSITFNTSKSESNSKG
jgi:hypothetical protein